MIATLAVDVGQTSSRLLLTHDDGRAESWESTAGRAGRPAEDTLITVVEDAARRLGSDVLASIGTVAAGLTGLQGRPASSTDVLAQLFERWRIRRVVVADDALTAYVGALGVRPGVVVCAGTGAVTLATDGASCHARVDGWGYLVGDLGSGYWIGRRGIEAALRAADGRDGSTELLHLAASAYGDLETLPQRLAADTDRVRLVARFAERVASAARGGDAAAVKIWQEAAEHLADSVAAASRRIGLSGEDVAVSWTGGLFSAGALLIEPFSEAVVRRLPDAVLMPPEGNGLEGARTLATLAQLPTLYPLLTSAVEVRA